MRGKQSSTKVKYAKAQLNLWAHRVRRDTIPVSEGGTGKLQSDYDRAYNRHRKSGMSVPAARHAAWQQATGYLERSLTDHVSDTGNGSIYVSRNRRYNVNR